MNSPSPDMRTRGKAQLWDILIEKIRMLRTARQLDTAWPVALHCLQSAREAFEPDDPRICRTLELLGDLAAERDRPQEALRYYTESYELCSETNDAESRARIATLLGALHRAAGNNSQASRFLLAALGASEQDSTSHDLREAGIANSLALIALEEGDAEAAELYYQQALRSCRARGSAGQEDAAIILNNLGILYFNADRLEEAEKHHQQAYDLRRSQETSDPSAISQSASNLAAVHHAQRHEQEADVLYALAIATAEEASLPMSGDQVVAIQNYAQLLRETGQTKKAKTIESKLARGSR